MEPIFEGWLAYLQKRLDNPETEIRSLPLEEPPDMPELLKEAEAAISAQPAEKPAAEPDDPPDVPDPKTWSYYCGTPV
jgi:hypothetical protein